MWGFALLFLLLGSYVSSGVIDRSVDNDDWREDLFLPGFKAQLLKEKGQQVVTERKAKRPQLASSTNETEEDSHGLGVSNLLKRGIGEFRPYHNPWSYGTAFVFAAIFAIAFVVHGVRRRRRSDLDDEVCHYDRLDHNQGDSEQSVQELESEPTNDIHTGRLLIQPLLERSLHVTKRHRGFSRPRGGREATSKPALKSLWSKIVRSSKELFVPEQFASDSTAKTAGAPRNVSTATTLPTFSSGVKSLQDMAEVEKTLWWRTM